MDPTRPAAPALTAIPARRTFLQRAAGCLVAGWWWQGNAVAANEGVAVIYPAIGEPYKAIFATIIEGIDARLPAGAAKYPIPPQGEPGAALDALKARPPAVVIGLGRAALRAALALEGEPVVLGSGIISPAEGDARAQAVVSLAPDPALLLQRMRSLLPGVRRVSVVYSAANSGWLMRPAQAAARSLNLELRSHEVADLRAALLKYQDILATGTAEDALWLTQDPVTVDEATVLPLVLQGCWNRGMALVSSNLAHVRRGALIALYPNNLELGRLLGAQAAAHLQRATPPLRGIVPLRELQSAINTRTASHLGLDMSARLSTGFDLTLPER